LKTKQSLGEQEISDLFPDEVSDMPSETIVATDSKSDSSCDENAGSNIAGTATWAKFIFGLQTSKP
jgi:hypothetical protein